MGDSSRKRTRSEATLGSKWDVSGQPAKGKVVKICTDVYPDPEPDEPLVVLTEAERIALKLREIKEARPQKVKLDEKGNLVDELGQKVMQDVTAIKELSVNRQKPKFDRAILEKPVPIKEEAPVEDSETYDATLRTTSRSRRVRGALSFTMENDGKFGKQAEKMRTLIQARQEYKEKKRAAEEAQKRGETLVVDPNLVPVQAKVEDENSDLLPVPDCEWWDSMILVTKSYEDIKETETMDPRHWRLKFKSITHYIEHPIVVEGPNAEPVQEVKPLRLTKKERKKLRTRARIAREKEKQEKIALHLMEPPPPRIRISNMMAVKGKEAIQDPTIVEKIVRETMAERVQRHNQRNQARRLDKDQKRKKVVNKMKKAADDDPLITVYRIRDLSSTYARKNLHRNAVQFHLSGFLILTPECNMLMVEGGPKPTRMYRKLVTRRQDYKIERGENDPPNAFVVWQGHSGSRSLEEFKTLSFVTSDKARKYLASLDAAHFWDLALQGKQMDLEESEGEADDIL